MVQKKKTKRTLLIKTAAICFAESGYHKTSMKIIGQRTGLHKASLYHYFQNKEDLFTKVIIEETEAYFNYLNIHIKEKKNKTIQLIVFLLQRIKIANIFQNINNLLQHIDQKDARILFQLQNYVQEKELALLQKLFYRMEASDKMQANEVLLLCKGLIQLSNTYRRELLTKEEEVQLLYLIDLILKGLSIVKKKPTSIR